MLCAAGGLAAMAEALAGLVVNTDAMAHNLTNLPKGQAGAAPGLIEAALAAHGKFEETGGSKIDR